MKPEIFELIKDDKNSEYPEFYDVAIKALDKEYYTDLTFFELVAITHFTHPNQAADLNHISELFYD